MTARPHILMVLLAFVVALSPLGEFVPEWAVHPEGDSHGHYHYHSHGGELHSHFHHHGDGGEEEPDDHHGLSDQSPVQAMSFWTAPRRTEIGPPPSAPPAIVHGVTVSQWQPQRRAKPPPLARLAQLKTREFIRTVILQV